jgi:predicted AAA+ superfamily ATPase
VGDLGLFTKFVKILASHIGQELNLTAIGNAVGINHKTAQSWISILEAGFIIHKLPPHFTNFNKVLVKRPKIYFYDTGLVCSLIGIQNEEQLNNHPLRGPIFETMLVAELIKERYNQGQANNLYYWRDKTGREIDIVIDNAGDLVPIEIKSSQTIASDFFKNIKYYQNLNKGQQSYLLYAGKDSQKRSDGTTVINWEEYFATT